MRRQAHHEPTCIQRRGPAPWCRWFALALLALTTPPAGADFPDQQLLTGLTERGLYRLVELHGRRLWQRDDLDIRQRADLAVQLASSLTAQALERTGSQRNEAWAQAEEFLDAFAAEWGDHPRELLIDIQRAMISMARAELAQLEIAGAAGDHPAAETAREQIRNSLGLFSAAAEQVDQALRATGRRRDDGGLHTGFSTGELASLRRNLNLQLGKAYRVQALSYPAGSADRDNAFQLALKHLERLAHQDSDEPLTWPARLATLRACRELGQLSRADELLGQWQDDSPPDSLTAELAAEQVRLALAGDQVDRALQMASAARGDSDRSGALGLARLEAIIAAWQQAVDDQSPDASEWSQKITDRLEIIRSQGSSLLTRRAELLAGRALADHPADQPAAALELAAENLFRSGRLDEAVMAYDRAAQQSRAESADDRAFKLLFTAAAIERQAGNLAAARGRFRRLAIDNQQRARAAEAHLLAIVAQAESLRSAEPAAGENGLAHYRELLQEHLATWPQAKTADEVRWWSAQLAMGDQRWLDALRLLEAVTPSSEEYGLATAAAADCYLTLANLATRDRTGDTPPPGDLADRARKFVQPAITGANNRWPDQWSDRQLILAEKLARLHLLPGAEDYEYAEQMLRAAWQGVADGGELRSTPIERALVDTLVRAGKYRDAAEVLLDHDQQSSDTLRQIETLAKARPQDGDLQEIVAALSADSESRQEQDGALQRWIEIERHSQRGGPRWLRARRARVDLLRRLGRDDQADKLLRLTRLLYPQSRVVDSQ